MRKSNKKSKVCHSKEKVPAPWKLRNLRTEELGSVIFGCKSHTLAECLNKKLFGLPDGHISYVKKVSPGLPLFLFNYCDRTLHGIFEATSTGQKNIDFHAWSESEGTVITPYAAQVRVKVHKHCRPLREEEFGPIIVDNYHDDKLFWFELDKEQASNLIKLFLSSPPSPHKLRSFDSPLPPKLLLKEYPRTTEVESVNRNKQSFVSPSPDKKCTALFKSSPSGSGLVLKDYPITNGVKSGKRNEQSLSSPYPYTKCSAFVKYSPSGSGSVLKDYPKTNYVKSGDINEHSLSSPYPHAECSAFVKKFLPSFELNKKWSELFKTPLLSPDTSKGFQMQKPKYNSSKKNLGKDFAEVCSKPLDSYVECFGGERLNMDSNVGDRYKNEVLSDFVDDVSFSEVAKAAGEFVLDNIQPRLRVSSFVMGNDNNRPVSELIHNTEHTQNFDYGPVVMKLSEEIEKLKFSQMNQWIKFGSLEREVMNGSDFGLSQLKDDETMTYKPNLQEIAQNVNKSTVAFDDPSVRHRIRDMETGIDGLKKKLKILYFILAFLLFIFIFKF